MDDHLPNLNFIFYLYVKATPMIALHV